LEWQKKQNGESSQLEPKGIYYEEFRSALDNIESNYLRLTNEETELILSISKNL
jgi:hypothetical protein